MERPQFYRLSSIPRSITWEEVGLVLAGVDRRTPCGKRDWAILLLLVTYGLRAREVAALTLDDIDWKRERLAVPERKAGHSTAFPLSASVGEALVDYLRHGRPQTEERRVFFRAVAPVEPIGAALVSARARHYLLKAGIDVPRPGSHTLRHTCVQRLVDADFAFKTIGDFVGHRSAKSTEIYAKVAVEPLRQVVLAATARRCSHEPQREHRAGGRAVPRAQARPGPQVPQRGGGAAAAGPLRRRPGVRSAGRAHARAAG